MHKPPTVQDFGQGAVVAAVQPLLFLVGDPDGDVDGRAVDHAVLL